MDGFLPTLVYNDADDFSALGRLRLALQRYVNQYQYLSSFSGASMSKSGTIKEEATVLKPDELRRAVRRLWQQQYDNARKAHSDDDRATMRAAVFQNKAALASWLQKEAECYPYDITNYRSNSNPNVTSSAWDLFDSLLAAVADASLYMKFNTENIAIPSTSSATIPNDITGYSKHDDSLLMIDAVAAEEANWLYNSSQSISVNKIVNRNFQNTQAKSCEPTSITITPKIIYEAARKEVPQSSPFVIEPVAPRNARPLTNTVTSQDFPNNNYALSLSESDDCTTGDDEENLDTSRNSGNNVIDQWNPIPIGQAYNTALFGEYHMIIVIDLSRGAFEVNSAGEVYADRIPSIINLILRTIEDVVEERAAQFALAKKKAPRSNGKIPENFLNSIFGRVWCPNVTISLMTANTPYRSDTLRTFEERPRWEGCDEGLQWEQQPRNYTHSSPPTVTVEETWDFLDSPSNTTAVPQTQIPFFPSGMLPLPCEYLETFEEIDNRNSSSLSGISGDRPSLSLVPIFMNQSATQVLSDGTIDARIEQFLRKQEQIFQKNLKDLSAPSAVWPSTNLGTIIDQLSTYISPSSNKSNSLLIITNVISGLLPLIQNPTVMPSSSKTRIASVQDLVLLRPLLVARGLYIGIFDIADEDQCVNPQEHLSEFFQCCSGMYVPFSCGLSYGGRKQLINLDAINSEYMRASIRLARSFSQQNRLWLTSLVSANVSSSTETCLAAALFLRRPASKTFIIPFQENVSIIPTENFSTSVPNVYNGTIVFSLPCIVNEDCNHSNRFNSLMPLAGMAASRASEGWPYITVETDHDDPTSVRRCSARWDVDPKESEAVSLYYEAGALVTGDYWTIESKLLLRAPYALGKAIKTELSQHSRLSSNTLTHDERGDSTEWDKFSSVRFKSIISLVKMVQRFISADYSMCSIFELSRHTEGGKTDDKFQINIMKAVQEHSTPKGCTFHWQSRFCVKPVVLLVNSIGLVEAIKENRETADDDKSSAHLQFASLHKSTENKGHSMAASDEEDTVTVTRTVKEATTEDRTSSHFPASPGKSEQFSRIYAIKEMKVFCAPESVTNTKKLSSFTSGRLRDFVMESFKRHKPPQFSLVALPETGVLSSVIDRSSIANAAISYILTTKESLNSRESLFNVSARCILQFFHAPIPSAYDNRDALLKGCNDREIVFADVIEVRFSFLFQSYRNQMAVVRAVHQVLSDYAKFLKERELTAISQSHCSLSEPPRLAYTLYSSETLQYIWPVLVAHNRRSQVPLTTTAYTTPLSIIRPTMQSIRWITTFTVLSQEMKDYKDSMFALIQRRLNLGFKIIQYVVSGFAILMLDKEVISLEKDTSTNEEYLPFYAARGPCIDVIQVHLRKVSMTSASYEVSFLVKRYFPMVDKLPRYTSECVNATTLSGALSAFDYHMDLYILSALHTYSVLDRLLIIKRDLNLNQVRNLLFSKYSVNAAFFRNGGLCLTLGNIPGMFYDMKPEMFSSSSGEEVISFPMLQGDTTEGVQEDNIPFAVMELKRLRCEQWAHRHCLIRNLCTFTKTLALHSFTENPDDFTTEFSSEFITEFTVHKVRIADLSSSLRAYFELQHCSYFSSNTPRQSSKWIRPFDSENLDYVQITFLRVPKRGEDSFIAVICPSAAACDGVQLTESTRAIVNKLFNQGRLPPPLTNNCVNVILAPVSRKTVLKAVYQFSSDKGLRVHAASAVFYECSEHSFGGKVCSSDTIEQIGRLKSIIEAFMMMTYGNSLYETAVTRLCPMWFPEGTLLDTNSPTTEYGSIHNSPNSNTTFSPTSASSKCHNSIKELPKNLIHEIFKTFSVMNAHYEDIDVHFFDIVRSTEGHNVDSTLEESNVQNGSDKEKIRSLSTDESVDENTFVFFKQYLRQYPSKLLGGRLLGASFIPIAAPSDEKWDSNGVRKKHCRSMDYVSQSTFLIVKPPNNSSTVRILEGRDSLNLNDNRPLPLGSQEPEMVISAEETSYIEQRSDIERRRGSCGDADRFPMDRPAIEASEEQIQLPMFGRLLLTVESTKLTSEEKVISRMWMNRNTSFEHLHGLPSDYKITLRIVVFTCPTKLMDFAAYGLNPPKQSIEFHFRDKMNYGVYSPALNYMMNEPPAIHVEKGIEISSNTLLGRFMKASAAGQVPTFNGSIRLLPLHTPTLVANLLRTRTLLLAFSAAHLTLYCRRETQNPAIGPADSDKYGDILISIVDVTPFRYALNHLRMMGSSLYGINDDITGASTGEFTPNIISVKKRLFIDFGPMQCNNSAQWCTHDDANHDSSLPKRDMVDEYIMGHIDSIYARLDGLLRLEEVPLLQLGGGSYVFTKTFKWNDPNNDNEHQSTEESSLDENSIKRETKDEFENVILLDTPSLTKGAELMIWCIVAVDAGSDTVEVYAIDTTVISANYTTKNAALIEKKKLVVIDEVFTLIMDRIRRIALRDFLAELQLTREAKENETFIPRNFGKQFFLQKEGDSHTIHLLHPYSAERKGPDPFMSAGVTFLRIPVHSSQSPKKLLHAMHHARFFEMLRILDRRGCFLIPDEKEDVEALHFIRVILVQRNSDGSPGEADPNLNPPLLYECDHPLGDGNQQSGLPPPYYDLLVQLYATLPQPEVSKTLCAIQHCYESAVVTEIIQRVGRQERWDELTEEDCAMLMKQQLYETLEATRNNLLKGFAAGSYTKLVFAVSRYMKNVDEAGWKVCFSFKMMPLGRLNGKMIEGPSCLFSCRHIFYSKEGSGGGKEGDNLFVVVADTILDICSVTLSVNLYSSWRPKFSDEENRLRRCRASIQAAIEGMGYELHFVERVGSSHVNHSMKNILNLSNDLIKVGDGVKGRSASLHFKHIGVKGSSNKKNFIGMNGSIWSGKAIYSASVLPDLVESVAGSLYQIAPIVISTTTHRGIQGRPELWLNFSWSQKEKLQEADNIACVEVFIICGVSISGQVSKVASPSRVPTQHPTDEFYRCNDDGDGTTKGLVMSKSTNVLYDTLELEQNIDVDISYNILNEKPRKLYATRVAPSKPLEISSSGTTGPAFQVPKFVLRGSVSSANPLVQSLHTLDWASLPEAGDIAKGPVVIVRVHVDGISLVMHQLNTEYSDIMVREIEKAHLDCISRSRLFKAVMVESMGIRPPPSIRNSVGRADNQSPVGGTAGSCLNVAEERTQKYLAKRCCGDITNINSDRPFKIYDRSFNRRVSRIRYPTSVSASTTNIIPSQQKGQYIHSQMLPCPVSHERDFYLSPVLLDKCLKVILYGLANRGLINNLHFLFDSAVKTLFDDGWDIVESIYRRMDLDKNIQIVEGFQYQRCEKLVKLFIEKGILSNVSGTKLWLEAIGCKGCLYASEENNSGEVLCFNNLCVMSADPFITHNYRRHISYAHAIVKSRFYSDTIYDLMTRLQVLWRDRFPSEEQTESGAQRSPAPAPPGSIPYSIVKEVVSLISLGNLHYSYRVPDFLLRIENEAMTKEKVLKFSNKRVTTSVRGRQLCTDVQSTLETANQRLMDIFPQMYFIELKPEHIPDEEDHCIHQRLSNRCGIVPVLGDAEPATFTPKIYYALIPIRSVVALAAAESKGEHQRTEKVDNNIQGGVFVTEIGFNYVNYALDFYIIRDNTVISAKECAMAASYVKQRFLFCSVIYDSLIHQVFDYVRHRKTIIPGQQLLTEALNNLLKYYPTPPLYSTNTLAVFDVKECLNIRDGGDTLKMGFMKGIRHEAATTNVLSPTTSGDNRNIINNTTVANDEDRKVHFVIPHSSLGECMRKGECVAYNGPKSLSCDMTRSFGVMTRKERAPSLNSLDNLLFSGLVYWEPVVVTDEPKVTNNAITGSVKMYVIVIGGCVPLGCQDSEKFRDIRRQYLPSKSFDVIANISSCARDALLNHIKNGEEKEIAALKWKWCMDPAANTGQWIKRPMQYSAEIMNPGDSKSKFDNNYSSFDSDVRSGGCQVCLGPFFREIQINSDKLLNGEECIYLGSQKNVPDICPSQGKFTLLKKGDTLSFTLKEPKSFKRLHTTISLVSLSSQKIGSLPALSLEEIDTMGQHVTVLTDPSSTHLVQVLREKGVIQARKQRQNVTVDSSVYCAVEASPSSPNIFASVLKEKRRTTMTSPFKWFGKLPSPQDNGDLLLSFIEAIWYNLGPGGIAHTCPLWNYGVQLYEEEEQHDGPPCVENLSGSGNEGFGTAKGTKEEDEKPVFPDGRRLAMLVIPPYRSDGSPPDFLVVIEMVRNIPAFHCSNEEYEKGLLLNLIDGIYVWRGGFSVKEDGDTDSKEDNVDELILQEEERDCLDAVHSYLLSVLWSGFR